MFKSNYLKLVVSLVVTLLMSTYSSFSPAQQTTDQSNSYTTQKTGVQLWADNCARCHNMRSPDSYSDTQWEVAVLHMRVRANLAAKDARAIADYLKSANN